MNKIGQLNRDCQICCRRLYLLMKKSGGGEFLGYKIFFSLKAIHSRQRKEYECGIFIIYLISFRNFTGELELKECEILLNVKYLL